jgi:hypothetical protein
MKNTQSFFRAFSKTHFFLFLFLIFSFSSSQAQWAPLGTAGFSPGAAAYQSMAINSSGTPYVAFSDNAHGDKLTVMKYDGSGWVTVGSAGFSSYKVRDAEIAINSSDVPYIIYSDGDVYKLWIMKFDGSNWVNVGSAISIQSYFVNIAFHNTTPYISFEDNSAKIRVMTFDGTNWVNVGTTGFSSNWGNNDLAVDGSGTLYLAYNDANDKTTVQKYNGSAWSVVGSASFSSGTALSQNIAIDGSGTPYVAYKDYSVSYKAVVKKFNGSSWVNVGTEGFTDHQIDKPSLAFRSDNTPVLAYMIYSYVNGGHFVIGASEFTGTDWEQLGLDYGEEDMDYPDLAIDGSDNPYIVFRDGGNSNKTSVIRFHPCVAPDIPTLTAASTSVCKNDEIVMWVTSGNLNSATEWHWYIKNGTDYYERGTGDTLVQTAYSTRTYYVRGEGGCDFSGEPYGEIEITVNDVPYVYAGPDQTVCDGEPVTLYGRGGDADVYTWDKGVTDNVPFQPPVGSTTYTVTGTVSATGCSATDEVVVTVNPLPTVNGGADRTVCDGESITLTASGNADSYSWDHGVTDGQPFTPPLGTTHYIVTGTITATGCSNSDTVTVTVNPLPTVSGGADRAVCDGESITLTASGNADTYAWDNGVTDGQPFTPPLGTTTFTVTGTITATGCSNTDEVKVTVNPLPAVSAGADRSICDGNQVTLSGSGADTYTWDKGVSNGVPFLPPQSSATVYTVTGTITATGCSNTDQVTVTSNPLPDVNAGDDQTVCDGEQVTLTGSGNADTYTWDKGVTDGTPFTPPVGTNTYTVTGTISATGCSKTDQVTVTVNPLPDVDAGEDLTVHEGDQVTLTATGADTYVWDKGVINGQPFTPPQGVNTYTVTGTITSTGCSNTDQVVVSVGARPLTGTYTIGQGGDFITFSEAIDTMKIRSVKDSVVFTILPGTYEEHFYITGSEIERTPLTAAIIFRAQTPDSGSTVLQYNATVLNEDYLVVLDGIGHITFEGITFHPLGTDYGTAIRLMNGAHDNTIIRNIFSTAGKNGSALYSQSGTLDDNNTFSHNRCYGGKYGISLWGTDESNRETGWNISGNLFSEQYDGAVILSYQQNSRTESNHISHTGSLDTEWKGIYVTGSQDQVIANNAVSFAADRQSVGIGLSTCYRIKLYYNTVHVYGETGESRCVNVQQGGSNVSLYNNILSNTSGGVILYLPDVSVLTSDYNDLHSNSDRFIYTDRWVTDLADWRSAYNKDQHSYSVDPRFFSADSVFTTAPQLCGTATPVTEVVTDITGRTRDAAHPDMGVYEFDGIFTIATNDTVLCNNAVTTLDAGAGFDTYAWSTGDLTQTTETSAAVNTEIWYKVTVTVGSMMYSDSVKVTSSGPVVDLGNDTSICQGSTLTLDAGAGDYSYLWSDNSTGQTLDVTTTGDYSVTVTDAAGCQGQDAIYVYTLPTQPVHLSWDGFNLMADNYNAVRYIWYRDGSATDTTTSYTYMPQASGDYFSEVTQENGCVVISDTLHVEITGIGRVNDPGLNIYPNPGSGHFTISFTNPVSLKEVKVFNTLGSLVYVYNPETLRDQVEIDLSDQPEGIYLIQMRTGDNQLFTRRIIIKR